MIYFRYLERYGNPIVHSKTNLAHASLAMLHLRGDMAAQDVHGKILQAQMEEDGDLKNIATWFLDGVGDLAVFQVDDGDLITFGYDVTGTVKSKQEFN